MKKTLRISIIMLFFTGGVLCWQVWESETAAQPLGQAVQFDSRIENTVREAGVLESANAVEIANEAPGTSTILWLIEDGQTVKKGDLLAQLDTSALDEQIELKSIEKIRAEAALAEAENLLKKAKLEQEFRIEQATDSVQQTELAIQSANRGENDLGLELKKLSRQVELTKQKTALMEAALKGANLTGGEQLENRLRLLDSQAELDAASATIEHLKTREVPRRTQDLQTKLELSQHRLEIEKLEQQARVGQAGSELNVRETIAKTVRQELETLKQARERCRVVAPRDGIVLYLVQAARRTTESGLEVGSSVRERQVLFTMPDLDSLQVRVKVHETRISQVKTGQSATLIFDALPEDRFAGKVLSIADSPLPGTWPNYDLKQYEVLVSLPKPDSKLKLGMTCVAEIQIAE
ncbi:MAG: efflux RND transporter periplasmic adaptor subunit [Planctomycetaceae bacterium]|nr:efflux RND transporter periplasmic adaptor subunit [Planctomycetaceae bacterium]